MIVADQAFEIGREDTHTRVIRNAPFGIYIVDSNFRLSEISEGCRKVFAQIEPALGRDFAEVMKVLWEEPFASDCIGRFRHTLETGESYRASDTSKPRSNIDDKESYDWKIERITLPDGRFGVVCYFYDLTERIQMADAHRESEEQLHAALNSLRSSEQFSRTVLESSPDCVKILDRTGRLEYVNANGICLLELDDPSEILGKYLWNLWPQGMREVLKGAVTRGLAGESTHFQAICPTARMTEKWWDVIVSPVPSGDGESPRVIAVSRDITQSKRAEKALRDARDQLEVKVVERTAELQEAHRELTGSLRDVVAIQETERKRIGCDVHDHLGGTLTGLRLNLESLHAETHDHLNLQSRIEVIQKIATQLDADISYLAWMLRPTILDDLGLLPALDSFVAEWSERFSVKAGFQAIGANDLELDRDVETNLYRITQEALTNIAKHAQATSVNVILTRGPDTIGLVVEDNGIGISRSDKVHGAASGAANHGLGIGGMRDRARIIGASSFEIETSDHGTAILVTVPTKMVP